MNPLFYLICLSLLCSILSSCLGTAWTGAGLVYDRHHLYQKADDVILSAKIQNAIYHDKMFRRDDGKILVQVYHKQVLLAGHVASDDLKQEALRRVYATGGFERLYQFIDVREAAMDNLTDSWITTKIQSQIIMDASIDPSAFKIMTVDKNVYLMGDVKRDQAEKVVNIAKNTDGVSKVVKLMHYFTYTNA